ncbi:hypothetical protein [Burkholderia sp. BCC0044]|nr:hypothetical protein [Burkholderia sp. BCC0044]
MMAVALGVKRAARARSVQFESLARRGGHVVCHEQWIDDMLVDEN